MLEECLNERTLSDGDAKVALFRPALETPRPNLQVRLATLSGKLLPTS